jgi:hypothetical protein
MFDHEIGAQPDGSSADNGRTDERNERRGVLHRGCRRLEKEASGDARSAKATGGPFAAVVVRAVFGASDRERGRTLGAFCALRTNRPTRCVIRGVSDRAGAGLLYTLLLRDDAWSSLAVRHENACAAPVWSRGGGTAAQSRQSSDSKASPTPELADLERLRKTGPRGSPPPRARPHPPRRRSRSSLRDSRERLPTRSRRACGRACRTRAASLAHLRRLRRGLRGGRAARGGVASLAIGKIAADGSAQRIAALAVEDVEVPPSEVPRAAPRPATLPHRRRTCSAAARRHQRRSTRGAQDASRWVATWGRGRTPA